jgi:hypothetical protein
MKETPERIEAFCAALASSGGNVSRACQAVDITRMTAYRWRENDPEFAEAWARAKQIGMEALEDEATRRAFEGVEKPVFYMGKKLRHTIREYSDTLAIFLLKGGMPEKYRERTETKHDVTGTLAALVEQSMAPADDESGG